MFIDSIQQDNDLEIGTSNMYILDLLKNRSLDEISTQENLNVLFESMTTLYLPSQLFNFSTTKERINRLHSLSYFEYYKFIKLYEIIVIYRTFDMLYYLESEENENLIAEKIIDFDKEYWSSQDSFNSEIAYQNMINSFINIYTLDRVRAILL
jgi:hypothetical protein